MVRPTSFRLPEELLNRLDEEAAEHQTTVSNLVATLLDEGLKTRRFPGIVHRDGPTGRRAGVVGGPDVWEVIRALRTTSGRGEVRVQRLAKHIGLPIHQIRIAVDYYSAFPDEVDERIRADERAALRLRDLVKQREALLSE